MTLLMELTLAAVGKTKSHRRGSGWRRTQPTCPRCAPMHRLRAGHRQALRLDPDGDRCGDGDQFGDQGGGCGCEGDINLVNSEVPVRQHKDMEFSSTVEFAHAARVLTRAAVASSLVAPSFRCPPRLVGVDRSIRRRGGPSGADPVVSVRVKSRQREAVLADMIEGVVIANGLATPDADRVRNELWQVMASQELCVAS